MSSSRAPTPSHTAFVPLLLLRPILRHMLLSPPSLCAPPTNHIPIQPTLENPPLLFLNTLPPSRPASGISHLLPVLTVTKNNTHVKGAPLLGLALFARLPTRSIPGNRVSGSSHSRKLTTTRTGLPLIRRNREDVVRLASSGAHCHKK